jgi:hypothetical protein
MTTTTLRTVLFALPLLATACGDDLGGAVAADFDGTWVISSLTVPVGTGKSTVTLPRSGAQDEVRGDAVFTATGERTADLQVRQGLLRDHLLLGDVVRADVAVELEGDRWILTADDGVTVFAATRAGEELTLVLDAEDARTTARAPAREVRLTRTEPWTTRSVGVWDLMSMATPSGTLIGNTCMPAGDGAARLQMMVAIDERLLYRRTLTTVTYADRACTEMTDVRQSVLTGMAEESQGALLQLWGREGDRAEYVAFSLTGEGGVLTLSRMGCLPAGCEDSVPLEVVVAGR